MKHLAKVLPLALLIGFCAAHPVASAHGGDDRQRPPMAAIDATAMTESMAARLGLDETQQRAVAAINQRFAADVQQQRDAARAEREQRHQRMRQLHDARDAELRQVLNDEQFERHMAAERERMGSRGQHSRVPGRAAPPAGPAAPPPEAP